MARAASSPLRFGASAPPFAGWVAAGIAIAFALALPVGVLVAALVAPPGESWDHLAATVLPDYVRTTAVLAALVLAGVVVVGTATAWIVTAYEFRGRRVLEWALLLPLAVPAYVIAYAYTDWLQFSGPVQTWLRATFDWSRGDYWFPEVRSL